MPFESTKAVRSYANFFQLLMRLRPMRSIESYTSFPTCRGSPGYGKA